VLHDFTEDLMVDARPIHAPGLRFRNPTDNLDLDGRFIFDVPVTGIIAVAAASAPQFFLRNRKFVRFPGLDDELPPVRFPDATQNRALEMTVTQPVDNHLRQAGEGFSQLGFGGIRRS